MRTADRFRIATIRSDQSNSVIADNGDSRTIRRDRVRIRSHTKTLGSNRARLTAIQAHHINARGMPRLVALKNDTLGIRRELPASGNHFASRNWPLLSHSRGKQYEVRRCHVLSQDKSPFAVWRKRVGRTLP